MIGAAVTRAARRIGRAASEEAVLPAPAFPANRPSCCVVQGATQWTMAHEVGHVLGLSHVNNNDRLMTGNGTGNITNPPPDLVSSEVTTMLNSNLTQDW